MKFTLIIAALILVFGCAHDRPAQPSSPGSGAATEADAKRISMEAVKTKEHWKRVDADARKLDTGWSVFVCPVPFRVAGPYVLVTIDESGHVTDYKKRKSSM